MDSSNPAHEAERVCIGAALLDDQVIEGLSEILRVEHFAAAEHRGIFAAMLALRERSERIDPVTLRAEMGDAAPGASFLAELMDGLPRMGNADGHARLVREAARQRAVLTLTRLIPKWLEESDGSVDLVIDQAQQALQRIHEGGNDRSFVVDAHEALKDAMRAIDRMATSGDGVTGVRSGLTELDELLGGLQPSAVYTLGARTRRGKSVFAAQLSVAAAAAGKRVLMFTLEMPPAQVAKRMLMSHAMVDKHQLVRGEGPAWARLSKSYSDIGGYPLEFDRHESPTLGHIKTHASRMKRAGGLDLVVIDYFQRCAVNGKLERWQSLGELARGIKSMAQALEVPVLLPAQLNRSAEDKRPTLSDLRECGDLEQESDVVMFLHPTPKKGVATDDHMRAEYPAVDLIVEKNRDGEQRVIPLEFDRRFVRFATPAKEDRAS